VVQRAIPDIFSQVAIPELYKECKQRVTAALKTAEFFATVRHVVKPYSGALSGLSAQRLGESKVTRPMHVSSWAEKA